LLSQTSYIDTILSCFSLSDVKPVASPILPGAVISKANMPTNDTLSQHYTLKSSKEQTGSRGFQIQDVR
jgi:hypothetical protein